MFLLVKNVTGPQEIAMKQVFKITSVLSREMFKVDAQACFPGLRKFRGREDVEDDIRVLEKEHLMESSEKKFSVWELVTDFTLREPLIIALTLQVAQQLSGINAVGTNLKYLSTPADTQLPAMYERTMSEHCRKMCPTLL